MNKPTPFEKLLINQAPKLQGLAIHLTRNDHDAEDLIQETIFKALKHKDKFETGTNLPGWLRIMMKNLFINEFRKQKKKPYSSTDFTQRVITSSKLIQNEGEAALLSEDLKSALELLPEGNRTCLILQNRGYKYIEIAELLQIPVGTVKSRIFLAKEELKKRLDNPFK